MASRSENDPMFDYDPEPSPLQAAVWNLLEDAGAPDALCSQVDKLIDEWERSKAEDSTYKLWNPDP